MLDIKLSSPIETCVPLPLCVMSGVMKRSYAAESKLSLQVNAKYWELPFHIFDQNCGSVPR